MADQHNLLNFIKSEHLVLNNRFNQLFDHSSKSGKWGELITFCETNFEENHHEKEELYIFEAIKDREELKSGGPNCTYYFDSYIHSPHLKLATHLAKEITGELIEPSWSKHVLEYRNKNLPLVIPSEDHEAGRILLKAIRHETRKEFVSQNNVNKLFQIYIELQNLHFQKEENCFIPMCMQMLPPSFWENQINQMDSLYPVIE